MAKEKLTVVESIAAPLPIENVDTDQIIPARFLKATDKEGFGDNLFRDWRYDKNNQPIAGFVLNNPLYKDAKILVASKNFGSGSSREHAAWAVHGFGFRVVVSCFIADIFKNNSLNNGIMPVIVSENFLAEIYSELEKDPSALLRVDLDKQEIKIVKTGKSENFEINSYKKNCLMNGYDDIDYLFTLKEKIQQYKNPYRIY